MWPLRLADPSQPIDVLCIGAHSDDIEIGCAATLLSLAARGHRLRVDWVVLSAEGARGDEARRSAMALLSEAAEMRVHLAQFRDAHFPAEFSALKQYLADLSNRIDPHVVFTHGIEDRHQDHRITGELTWQAWRNHLILEYEIPKYEGDLPRPNFFVPLTRAQARAKVEHLVAHFASQRSKKWFSAETFNALMHLRGIECRATEGFAEGFVARKLTI